MCIFYMVEIAQFQIVFERTEPPPGLIISP